MATRFSKFRRLLAVSVSVAISGLAYSASPPNISANINWSGPFTGGVTEIQNAFNNARRQEESQLGLAANTLGNLVLPSQATWDGMSDDAKALYLLNAERTARAGMTSGVIGLPFAGIEQSIDGIAQTYGDLLHDNDATGHTYGGTTPFTRISNHPVIGTKPPSTSFGTQPACHEFINRAENLAYFMAASTAPIGEASVPMPVERAIYNWIYADAASSWGHREAALLQDIDLGNHAGYGFKNNHDGSAQHEGFIGIYRRGSTDYKPFSSSYPYTYGVVVVMTMFDPVSNAAASANSCTYNVTLRTEDLPSVSTDTDGDGVPDATDNCTNVANPDQRDTDGDGYGNLCDADLNNDGTVNFSDLAMMKAAFFTNNPHADLNGDGTVNFSDLALMKAMFFQAPGPGVGPGAL